MSNLYLFTGEETFLLNQQISAWKEAFKKRFEGDLNLVTIDGATTEESEIISQIETMPFLAEKRLIFIENLPEAAKASAKDDEKEDDEEKPAKGGQKILDYLNKIPDTSVVVFVQPKPDKRKSLYKKIVQLGELKEYNPLTGAALNQWIRQQAAAYKVPIDPGTTGYLVEQVGENLWRLDHELQKLSSYTAGRPVTRDAIDELVIPTLEANIFHLTDALGAKDHRKAIQNLHRVMAAGENLRQTFYMVVRQFRLLLTVAGYLSNYPNTNAASLASSLKMHPFVARNTLGQVKRFNMPELKTAYRKLLDLDLAMKTSKIQTTTDNQDELALAIEKFILEFCR